jgi:hypothetical protein
MVATQSAVNSGIKVPNFSGVIWDTLTHGLRTAIQEHKVASQYIVYFIWALLGIIGLYIIFFIWKNFLR